MSDHDPCHQQITNLKFFAHWENANPTPERYFMLTANTTEEVMMKEMVPKCLAYPTTEIISDADAENTHRLATHVNKTITWLMISDLPLVIDLSKLVSDPQGRVMDVEVVLHRAYPSPRYNERCSVHCFYNSTEGKSVAVAFYLSPIVTALLDKYASGDIAMRDILYIQNTQLTFDFASLFGTDKLIIS